MEIFMIRREIKEFKLSTDGVADFPVGIPFTVYSALVELGRVKRGVGDPYDFKIESAKVSSILFADGNFFNGKYSYLRISGVETECNVYLNQTLLATLDGKRRMYLVDTLGALKEGDNHIEIEFTKPSMNSGILGSIEFLKFNGAVIDGVKVTRREDDGAVTLDVELDTVGDAENVRAVATLISGSGQIYYGGFNKGHASVTVRDPLYWWPGCLGVHNVYKLSVNLYGEVEVVDTAEYKIGLSKMYSEGARLSVNGISFTPMGAVYTPEDNLLPYESRKRTAAFVTSAAMANFNTFVIKADTALPSDEFFDLCDVHGIAVICQVTKIDDAMIDAISRLYHHPSFAPIDVIGFSPNEFDILKKELDRRAPGVEISVFDKAPEYFGEASIPVDKTMSAVISKEDENIFSDAMEKHSGGSVKAMAYSVSNNYLYAWTPSDFAYLTRLSQAENCKDVMLKNRCDMLQNSRAVFSSVSAKRLISDSSVDHNVSWKALHYHAKKFFSPAVIRAEVLGTSVSFSASNAGKVAVFGSLEYRIVDSNNVVIYKNSRDIDIAEHSSHSLFSCDFSEHILSHERDRYLEFIFSEGSHVLSRGVELFVPEKRFEYKEPNIKAVIEGKDRRFSITLTAEKYAGAVELSFEGVDAVFSDNYFDITTPMPIKITFTVNSPIETTESLTKQLKIRSLYDVGRII